MKRRGVTFIPVIRLDKRELTALAWLSIKKFIRIESLLVWLRRWVEAPFVAPLSSTTIGWMVSPYWLQPNFHQKLSRETSQAALYSSSSRSAQHNRWCLGRAVVLAGFTDNCRILTTLPSWLSLLITEIYTSIVRYVLTSHFLYFTFYLLLS